MSKENEPRWYVLNVMHMATLCAGREDAEACAAEYDQQYPLRAPHRAVQMVSIQRWDVADAYCGAREDLDIWKRRALEAEEKLRDEIEVSRRIVSELNAENGPTHMGEPARKRKPLSVDRIKEISVGMAFESVAFARAIESAHGIGEKT